MPAPPLPFEAEELRGMFSGLVRPFAIAVSGGADSMALMHLVCACRRNGDGTALPPPLVLTVDHGLRPEGPAETVFVAEQARRLGLQHETLRWDGPKPSSGIQDAARHARYDLILSRLSAENPPRDLVLAHTLEDQAETLLMRLARGSGIDGLSAMRPCERRIVVKLGHPVREIAVDLLRPLLDIAKGRLVAHLRAGGHAWREDPSNSDVRFERVRVRQAAGALAALGLTPESLGRTARRLRDERAVLRDRTRALAKNAVNDHGGAFGEFSVGREQDWLVPDLVRLITPLLNVFGGTAPPAQLSQIETLAERVRSISVHAKGRLTLGGCLVEIDQRGDARRLRVYREFARHPLPQIKLEPGQGAFWDRRFYISVADAAAGPVEMVPFGATAADPSDAKLPRRCLAGLPAIGQSGTAEPRLLMPPGTSLVACQWPPQHARRVRWLEDEPLTLETN